MFSLADVPPPPYYIPPMHILARLAALGVITTLALPLSAQVSVSSPDGRTTVTVETHEGRLYFSGTRGGRALVMPSMLGFTFKDAPPLRDSLRITDTTRATHDETWTQPWGEVKQVREHYDEVAVTAAETVAPNRHFVVMLA